MARTTTAGNEVTLDVALLSDFGTLYHAATLASGATIAASHGTRIKEHRRPVYADYDIAAASSRIGDDLEAILADVPQGGVLASAFVVDPLKDRKNLVTKWGYQGRTVYLGHPDRGQVTGLLGRAGWELLGAAEIDKALVVPDKEVARECRQLWDGHAAYMPGAVHAALYGLDGVGPRVDRIRTLSGDGLAEAGVPLTQDKRIAPPRREGGTVVHLIGDEPIALPDADAVVRYGKVDGWREAAEAIEFAGTNALRGAGVQHLIVCADGTQEYAAMRAGPVVAIAPNDASLTLLDKYTPAQEWALVRGNAPDVVRAAHEGLIAWGPKDLSIYTNHYFDVIEEEPGRRYRAQLSIPDGNGNVRLFFNPHQYGIDWSCVAAMRVELASGEELGTFGRKDTYTPDPASGYRTADGKELAVILNPGGKAVHADGTRTPSRRSRIELHIPCGSLLSHLRERGVEGLQVGDHAKIEFLYR